MNLGRILITGGAGFIGSQLAHYLLPKCDHMWIIDDLSTGRRSAVPDDRKVSFNEGSILDDALLQEVLPQVDVVFHLACRNVTLSVNDLENDFQTNNFGGFFLMQKAIQYGKHVKRFVYTSTASVYGDAHIIPTPESYYNIALPYSASKFAAEHYAQVFWQMDAFPVSVVRLSNVYGPGQVSSNPYCGVVAKFFDALQSDQPLTIYGNGQQTRDFTYIEDALQAIETVAIHPDAIGRVFNVGTGVETSVKQLADLVLDVAEKVHHPLHMQPKRVIDVVQRRTLDIRFIHETLGWQPKYGLREGLRKTYRWILGEYT